MLGSLILYLKGMRIMMFQLSGFYCKPLMRRSPFRGVGGAAGGSCPVAGGVAGLGFGFL